MEKVSKSFFGVRVLRDVDFDLSRGEVHVLLGENGAGKSTLMKILSGAYTLDAGAIFLEGVKVNLAAFSPRSAEDAGIVSIYQNFHLVPHLSVAENLSLSRFAHERGLIAWKEVYDFAREALGRIDLQVDLRTPVRQLPVSKKQMLEIAIALSKNARILIMDEPTAALSRKEVEALFKTIGNVKAAGIGVIYISHKLEEIKQIGDRVTVLRDGANVGTMLVRDMELGAVIALMTGKELQRARRSLSAGNGGDGGLQLRGLSIPGSFREVSFQIRRREILGLTGLVGAGKTELARAIFGVDRLQGGEILIDGKPVVIDSPRRANRYGIGFLPEDRDVEGLCLSLGVKENISMVHLAKLRGLLLNTRREKETARSLVSNLNIRAESLSQQVKYLSGGNKQKVVFAKWLSARCRILVLDEPTFGIDVGAREEIYSLIDDFAHRQGNSVLFISSDIEEILAMADRVLVMSGGRLAAELDPATATKQQVMEICLRRRTEEGG
jgi:ribose transport system ATP-binding protein